jgi:hypothetical protein
VVIASDYPFLDILGSMLVFFGFAVTQSEFDAIKAKAVAA